MIKRALVALLAILHPHPLIHRLPDTRITGYCDRGLTATGTQARWGEAAVDPRTIPLGSWIRIPHLGIFHAEDTGGAVIGAHVDVWTPTCAMAYQITGWRSITWWRGSW